MPLEKGRGKKVAGRNIGELITSFKRTGKIGNVTPLDMDHAQRIASAIAFSKAGISRKKSR